MDTKERIALGSLTLGVLVAGIAALVFILNGFAGKASAADLASTRDRLDQVERALGRLDVNVEWTKSAVFALTQHAGVPVPPPPALPAHP